MAWPVYSYRLLKCSGAAGAYTFTVPAQYTGILKCISVTNGGAAGAAVDVSIAGTVLWVGNNLATNSNNVQLVHQVAHAGEVIRAGLSSSGLHVMLSGFLIKENPGASTLPVRDDHTSFEPWPEPKL